MENTKNTTNSSAVPTSVRLSLSVRQSVADMAEIEERSFSKMCDLLIRDGLAYRKNQPTKHV